MRQFSVPLIGLFFFISLFTAILLSVPALNINDEWITVNQLYQLGSGHQVVYNEGKYGSFLSGESTPYFLERHNVLGYSLALPIFSLPILILFKTLDSAFRLFPIFVASGCLLISGIILMKWYPKYCVYRSLPWPWLFIILGFFLLIVNMLFFTPFYAQDPYPIEVAAVVFTEHILFAILSIILILTLIEIFHDQWFALFGTITLISCSSFLYWTTNAKDHLLTAVCFALIIFFYIRYLQKKSAIDALLSFFCSGLLLWIRPELGVTTCAVITLILVMELLLSKGAMFRDFLKTLICACVGILSGSIPFLLNNSIVTGNPLIPIFMVYSKEILGDNVAWEDVSSTLQNSGGGTIATQLESVSSGGTINPFHGILTFYSPHWNSMFQDLPKVLFSPDTGMMSVIGMSPLILLAIALLPILYFYIRECSNSHKKIILFLFILTVTVLLTYFRNLPGLSMSEGIGPDMRYLTPIYIPGGILGLFTLYYGINAIEWRTIVRNTFFLCLLGSPVVILLLLLLQPLGGGFIEYTYTLSLAGTITAGIVAAYMIFSFGKNRIHKMHYLLLPLLCIFPLSWQIMMVFLFSITKFNGYPFWLPLVEHVYSLFIIPVG